MTRLRLAHFSDVHYTLSPFDHLRESLEGKRVANIASYLFAGRKARFANVQARIATLLEDIDTMRVDHALCTGDLTSSTLNAELAGLAALFGPRMRAPDRYTVLPGNHDRYVPSAVREKLFERHFASLCPSESGFPFEKWIAPGVRIVVYETARPTSPIDSSGLCGAAQREALRALLARDTASITFVAMHYGLLRWRGTPDRSYHGMRDYREVMALLDDSPARIALVLHGHMHGAFTVPTRTRSVICAGSATDLLVDCGYFVYDMDLESLDVRIERRHWDRHTERYVSQDCAGFEDAVRSRRGERLAHQRPLL